jgi:uncharacterized protein (TIGR03437 family)
MKKITLLLLVFSIFILDSTFVDAQTSCANRGFRFKTSKYTEAADFPRNVVIADFNNDGNLDIANYQSSTPIQNFRTAIEIQLGNGKGDFAVSGTLKLGYIPSFFNGNSLGSGDFNGDGNIDLCFTDSGKFKVWLGTGKGTFGDPKEYPLAADSQPPFPFSTPSLVISDVNSDGRSDVIFTASSISGTPSLYVLLAAADGSFSVPKITPAVTATTLYANADFNGDGKPDLIGATQGTNSLLILLNEGSGKFSAPVDIGITLGSFTIADFNGDQHPDLIVSNSSTQTTSVFFNNGSGGFSTSKLIFNRLVSVGSAGDFNKDGKQDFVYTQNPGNQNFSGNTGVCFGDGTGNFSPVTSYMVGVSPSVPFAADFNKDGLLDLFFIDNAGFDVVLGEANGIFNAPQFAAPLSYSGASPKFIIGEINKDSMPDLVMFGSGVSLFPGRGTGGFKDPVILDGNKYKFGGQTFGAAISDFNKDGNNDLAILSNYYTGGNSPNNTVTILRGNNAGGFTETDTQVFAVGQTPSAIKTADFNADGFPDLVVTNSGSHTASILINNRLGQFLPAVTIPTGLDPQAIATSDFNGDSFIDVVISNRSSAGLTLLLNDGAGGFTSSLIGIAANPGVLQAADVNGDGKPDLIIAQVNANFLTVLISNGNGTFGTRMNIPIPGRITDFALLDINQDGKIDLASTINNVPSNQSPTPQNRVAIYVGDGTGKFNFGAETIASQPVNLAVNDLNGDGTPDLSVAGQYGVQTFLSTCNSPANLLSLTAVNAASYLGFDVAPEGIVAAFGSELSASTATATTLPLPLTLGGSVTKIKDSKGVERTAPLFFVSPGQVNFQVPAGTELGFATVTINNGAGKIASGAVLVTAIKPAIFTANSDGTGVIAANALRVANKTGGQTYEPLLRFDDTLKRFVGVPILLPTFTDTSDALYLILYGTGIRGRSEPAQVRVFVGGVAFNVDYAGAHCCFVGVDQINVRIYDTYPNPRGEVDVKIEVDGKVSNIGKIFLE